MSDALDSQFRDTDRRVRDADRRVSDLDSRLDDLEGEHERLKSRFGYTEDLDHELRSLRDDISNLETTTEELDGRVDELDDRVEAAEQKVKRLTQHVRLLEGQIMAVGNVPPADLDTYTKDQGALAATMESGWEAADALLTSSRRTHHHTRVQRFHDAQARHRATWKEVVALVGTLLSTPYSTQPHAKAATKLRSVIARARPPSSKASPGRLPKHARPPRPSPRTGRPPPKTAGHRRRPARGTTPHPGATQQTGRCRQQPPAPARLVRHRPRPGPTSTRHRTLA
ncbi:hypothetical protein [Streptomyces sp. NPDC088730]|uniref:hypothetical protein n=1 Tax=Streptomyces sp. NPDC088730 TaxID=3365877 RepID=UPI003821494C